MSEIAVITTFPNDCFEVYAKQMLQSFAQYWPAEVPLLVQLDDDSLAQQVQSLVRPQDAVATGWEKDHKDFVERNKGRDHPTDYRKQAVRFCHKVFAIKRALRSIVDAKAANESGVARYLIWMDADVHTTKPVTMEDIRKCLPKEGDAVAYLGRKDWDHSECGWLAFDLDNGGAAIINNIVDEYVRDKVFEHQQWHDSWLWDICMGVGAWEKTGLPRGSCVTNLTPDAKGRDVWEQSPMAAWSTHYKGPEAKAKLAGQKQQQQQPRPGSNIVINTRNALPDEEICHHIDTNQMLIRNWIQPCKSNDEEIVVVSAGPMLVAEDVREDAAAGKRIVAVKHALNPLKEAGVKPWACILLDPREHVAKFVEKPDKDILWFVASQVDPEVTKRLLDAGCAVWGYHAIVGAGENELIAKQQGAMVNGGSATATRGLFVLSHLGFRNFKMYGYDLCYPDKPDMTARDELGQPKYIEISYGMNNPLFPIKRVFWTEPQFIAQLEELQDLMNNSRFNINAVGDGIFPFLLKAKRTGELRLRERWAKIEGENPPTYEQLLKCSRTTKSLTKRPSLSHKTRRRPRKIIKPSMASLSPS